MTLSVRERILNSVQPVVEHSRLIHIDRHRISKLAEKIKDEEVLAWNDELQYAGAAEKVVYYYFFLDSINFCFWAKKGEEKWHLEKNGEQLNGYYAFSYAIKRAFEQNENLWQAVYAADLAYKEFVDIFQGKGVLLLLPERHRIIQENFGILEQKYNGDVSALLGAAEGNVNTLVDLLVRDFPTFCDWVEFEGNQVMFLKRAQIFVSDVVHGLRGEGLGRFENMGDLAIFADYKLPQLLEAEGILVYEPELRARVAEETLIDAGSQGEVEIRANTVYASELLRQELAQLGREITSNDLDWLLWVAAKQTNFSLPHHKTLTTFY